MNNSITLPVFKTITQFKEFYKSKYPDLHWFDKDTIKFFDTKLMKIKTVDNSVYLLHSDKKGFTDFTREYKITRFKPCEDGCRSDIICKSTNLDFVRLMFNYAGLQK